MLFNGAQNSNSLWEIGIKSQTILETNSLKELSVMKGQIVKFDIFNKI